MPGNAFSIRPRGTNSAWLSSAVVRWELRQQLSVLNVDTRRGRMLDAGRSGACGSGLEIVSCGVSLLVSYLKTSCPQNFHVCLAISRNNNSTEMG